jgi:Bacterial type III secretion protein (HrpB7)
MNNRLRSLRTIVRVRERQQTRLEEALSAQRALLRDRQAECDEAEGHRQRCELQETSAAEQRRALLGGQFVAQQLMAMDLCLKSLAAVTAQAAQALAKCRQALEKQDDAVRAAQREVRRNAQRIESFEERIVALLREQECAAEEAVDEETGESFTARLMARRRAAQDVPQRHA